MKPTLEYPSAWPVPFRPHGAVVFLTSSSPLSVRASPAVPAWLVSSLCFPPPFPAQVYRHLPTEPRSARPPLALCSWGCFHLDGFCWGILGQWASASHGLAAPGIDLGFWHRTTLRFANRACAHHPVAPKPPLSSSGFQIQELTYS